MGARQTILDPSLNSPEVREFEKALRQRVVGQDRAVRRLARVYQVYPRRAFHARAAGGQPAFPRAHRLRQDTHGRGCRGGPF